MNKKTLFTLIFSFVCLTVIIFAGKAEAQVPLVDVFIDLDTTTTGIQNTLTVNQGDIFTVAVMLQAQDAMFDVADIELLYNSVVLGTDITTLQPGLLPGLVTPSPANPTAANGLFTGFGPYTLMTSDAENLFFINFSADAIGTSDITPSAGIINAPTAVAFFGTDVTGTLNGGTVTVTGGNTVPEPATMLMMLSGLTGLGIFRKKISA